MSITLTVDQFVKTDPAQVYFAFTHAMSLTEWMCDFATVAPRPGGRMYLYWHGDFYSAGEFISLEENKSITFKWHSRQDPASSQVEVTLQEKEGGTQVALSHTLPDGTYWEEHAEDFRQEWTRTLANLAQVLETGLDKRTFDRPLLGINISDFNPRIARSMGVPVNDGLRLDFLPEEMGAYKAGLRKDDVIIAVDNHPITNDFGSLVTALQGKKGGDLVEITFYRGSEKMRLPMELTRRPVPQIPWDPDGLARTTRKKYDEGLALLEKACKKISEAEAEFHPAPDQWSVKEILAHLIQSERHWLENLEDGIGGYPRLSDDWAGNNTIHVRATAKAYMTVRGLLDEMNRLSIEMVDFLSNLPIEFISRKASYFQAANTLMEASLPHISSHIDQIQSAIVSARKKK